MVCLVADEKAKVTQTNTAYALFIDDSLIDTRKYSGKVLLFPYILGIRKFKIGLHP